VTGLASVVLVGGGQVSAVAARTLRRRGYDGAIVVICGEPHHPYQRPPLSKEYLTAADAADATALDLLPEAWLQDNAVEVRVDVRAVKVSPADGCVVLSDGWPVTPPMATVVPLTGALNCQCPFPSTKPLFTFPVTNSTSLPRELPM